MRNFFKGLFLFIIITAIAALLPGFMDSTYYTQAADEAIWSGSEDPAVENYFTVVEVVPYKGMAEIGYLVGGQEPINKELMALNTAPGQLSFLGGAITVYPSYTEKPLPITGAAESGWWLARTVEMQNGYFENVGNSNGGRYSLMTSGENFRRVADGTGNFRAVLTPGVDMESVYQNAWEPTNRKNVKAYFVFGKPSGVALFNGNFGYEPYSVTARPNKDGNYDYDTENQRFLLNKGNGTHDVIFIRSSASTNLYYMTADYQIVEDCSGDYSFPVSYVAQSGGNYVRETNNYFVYDRWNGAYRFVQDDTALTRPHYTILSGRTWVRNQRVIREYQYTYTVELVNNEWLKRLTLGVPASQVNQYPVRVITITPTDLNKPENQHLIEQANLFYFNANYGHNGAYITLYENFSFEGINLPYNQKYGNNQNSKQNNLNFAVNDLSWTSVEKIFRRAAGIGCHKAALIFDSTFYQDAINGQHSYSTLQHNNISVSYTWNSNKATLCNMAKLFIMVNQRNMIDFYNSFMNPATTTHLIREVASAPNRTGTTGSFIRPDSTNPSPTANAAIYWNGNTFLPYGLNAEGVMVRIPQDQLVSNGIYNFNLTAQTTDLTNNVLIIGGSDIFTSKFIQALNIPSDSQETASNHLTSLNPDGTPVTTFTLADIVNVITNNGTGYSNVGGVSYPDGSHVEGIPTGTPGTSPEDDGTDGSNLRNYKRVLNIQPTADFTASENAIKTILSGHTVQIVNMTSTQFNASIEDINVRYDMIYMGSGAGRFNYSGSRTNFNDTTMNNLIYFSVGDMLNMGGGVTLRYRGNDITPQKNKELVSYLNAGYPVVLDSGLYQLTNVGAGTNIRTFITQSKSNSAYNSNLLNMASSTTTTFKARLISALNIARPTLKLVEPVIAPGSSVQYSYADPITGQMTIKFSLIPRGILPSLHTYHASLYIDRNGDGIFDEAEKINTVSGDGSTWDNMRESNLRIYTYLYDMSELNGVYQWKIIVRRSDNQEIRGALSGYAVSNNRRDINILHIRENGGAYNLANKINDTASLIWMYGKRDLTDYNLVIDTLTVQQFHQLYTTAPYTTATADTTNKLANYHLLILDNPTTAILNTNGALTNIRDEINKNLGIIFTKNALDNTKQNSYYNAARFSFQEPFTYNYLTRNSRTGQLYIYSNLATNGNIHQNATYNTTFLTKTNEGTITRYPYQINQAIRMAQNSFSNQVTIDFDLLQNRRIIGWYSLSDSKSPVVRSAGLVTGGTTAELYQGMYSSSPNDVKNNYYLFSNGNSFYSGIQLLASDVAGNDNEIKLFINTIVAAFKASGRVVSNPPELEIIHPVPVTEPDLTKSITIAQEDITGTDFILTFEIKNSSSKMDLSILMDGAAPSGSWANTVYEVLPGGLLGSAISINNTLKVVENRNYAVRIPVSQLVGEHVLSLSAVNIQGLRSTIAVTLRLIENPVVTIIDPVPIANAATQIIYVDMDFMKVDTGEDALDYATMLRVEFKIEKALTNIVIGVTSEGNNIIRLTQSDPALAAVYRIGTGGSETYLAKDHPTQNGDYALYIPISMMRGISSMEVSITATDSFGYSGDASAILLRRNLFQLD